jgi:hypothetical protein
VLADSPRAPFPVCLAVGALLSGTIAAPVALLFRPGDFVLDCRLVGEQPFDGQENLLGCALLPLALGALNRQFGLVQCLADGFKPALVAGLGKAPRGRWYKVIPEK